jgi:hypothetical protein
MDATASLICANPAGESKNAPQYPPETWPLDTPGGRYYAEWDDKAPVTRDGQLIFFFQFLQAGGRWQEFLRECLLHYTGNRGSGALNVMGTVLLSVLAGHWRYAHINGLRRRWHQSRAARHEWSSQRGRRASRHGPHP